MRQQRAGCPMAADVHVLAGTGERLVPRIGFSAVGKRGWWDRRGLELAKMVTMFGVEIQDVICRRRATDKK